MLIAVTHICVLHRCFKVFWSKLKWRKALYGPFRRAPLFERVCVRDGAFFGSLSKSPWGWGKLACARGGSRLSPEGGGGGVWEMDTCDRTYVWSSLSAFFFTMLCTL